MVLVFEQSRYNASSSIDGCTASDVGVVWISGGCCESLGTDGGVRSSGAARNFALAASNSELCRDSISTTSLGGIRVAMRSTCQTSQELG